MHIEPLSYATLDEAINLINKVFPSQTLFERATLAFPLSLRKNSTITKIIFRILEITEVRYWVAVDEDCKRVIGTTGLYGYLKDIHEAYWLAWTCVSPTVRGQGIGSKLVDFSIEKARAEGKQFLRLYTSNSPDEAVAQILYQKRGFRLIGEDKIWGSKSKKLYFELKL
ncbi:GNAT family N-acetyltransferase [Nostoc sp. CCY0012]|uniref:GNAT family N-acetyltransferase n=1 Tax=Nostoc sp. CCY0012 TaxID=1056123 RepID=UPI0039C6B26F